MDELAIEIKEPAQEVGVTSQLGGNNSSCVIEKKRKRNVSGPYSEGEKSLLKRKPAWLISPKIKTPVLNSCLCSLDEVVATPAANVKVIDEACNSSDKDFSFFRDVINSSKYVAYIDSAFASLGLFAVSIGIYVIKYCKLREIERNSNYFYFSRLFKTFTEANIENKMGEIKQDNSIKQVNSVPEEPITYEYLRTVAYYYPPDISKIACWRRRFFSSGKERERLKALNKFLRKNSKEKETLDKLRKKIIEQVCQLLNCGEKFKNFETKGHENNWTIGLAPGYKKDFFNHIQHLIKENSTTTLEKNKNKKNQSFIPSILAALGQASFIYWILMFIFCFIPIAPAIASISVIPLGIVLCIVLPFLLFYEVKKTYQSYKTQRSMTEENIETQHKQMLEKKLVKLNKQKIFLGYLKNKNANSSVKLKDSPLMKDFKKVIKNRHFIKYYAICMGFLDGCFLPLFVGWVLLDGVKVILTFAFSISIGFVASAIISGVILLMGISYGIYLGYKANQDHEAKFDDLKFKIDVLEQEVPDNEVLNKSLRDYDRLLRRFSDELPIWTNIKKGLNRFLVFIKRLGTGSLVFRLVMWGPITAIYAAVVASTAVPAFFPIIIIIGTVLGALILATWYLFSYNLERKTIQAGSIVEHLVQSEQLAWVNKQLSIIPVSVKCLDLQESSTEIRVSSENLTKSENDTQFKDTQSLQETTLASAENNGLDKTGGVTTQNEARVLRNNSNSRLSELFKDNPYLEDSENIHYSTPVVVISC